MLYTYKCFFDCTGTDSSSEVETEEINKSKPVHAEEERIGAR